jgi:hypothetical protein
LSLARDLTVFIQLLVSDQSFKHQGWSHTDLTVIKLLDRRLPSFVCLSACSFVSL